MSVPGKDYYRQTYCTLNQISMFVLQFLFTTLAVYGLHFTFRVEVINSLLYKICIIFFIFGEMKCN